jgi:LPS-assembly lipoprotein
MRARLAVLLCLGASLAACGFHWAGSRALPPELLSVYIDVVTPYSVSKPPIDGALRSRLLRRGALIAGSADAARTVLRITDLAETREVLSVDPFGKAVEYKLTSKLRYELVAQGRAVLPPDGMQVSRDYSFNAQQVLAKEAEEQRLQAFMQDELAELLLLRLDAMLTAPAIPPEAPAGGEPKP